jgi:beta-glucosidase
MTDDPDARAEALLDQMTLDEQLTLLVGHFPFLWKEKPDDVQPSAGYVPGIPRLGIPPLRETDASLGVSAAGRRDDLSTALPCGLALASGWSPEAAEFTGALIGAETRAKGFNVLLAGGVNLTREPRNGRNFEYLGEDPLLAGRLAGASIRGVQSNSVVSTVKHFALNSQETGRMVMSADIAEPGFRESDLLAFQIAIEDGRPAAVMSAYNRINGSYACDSAHLLAEVLRRDWGYPGWVMSDWGGVHSTAQAVAAGLDQQSGQELDQERYYSDGLRAALAAGEVTAAHVRTMAHRILRSMAASGLLDHPVELGTPNLAADAAAALEVARTGIVLLRNDGLLPLARGLKVVVIGGHADVGVLSGGGSSQVIPKGSARFEAPAGSPWFVRHIVYHPDPPLAALRARLGEAVTFDDGTDQDRAAAAARGADVAIVFATQWATEGKDTTLGLDGEQDALIAAVAAANPRTVVALQTGNPVLMPWLGEVAAVLEAWYPGAQGGKAIADILTGAANPSGRLPISFPAGADQLPHPELPGAELPLGPPPRSDPPAFAVDYHEGSDVGYRWFARTGAAPLFPFGFGLAYTTFAYAALTAEGPSVTFEVTNTGPRAGVETAQLYLAASPGRRQRRLLGWAKVTLRPGETQRVTITAEPRLLADWREAEHAFVIAVGRYEVFVAPDSMTPALTGSLEVAAANLGP